MAEQSESDTSKQVRHIPHQCVVLEHNVSHLRCVALPILVYPPRWRGWLGHRGDAPGSAGISGPGLGRGSTPATATATPDGSRSGTPPISLRQREREKEREKSVTPSIIPVLRHQRSSSPLTSGPSVAERRNTPPLPLLGRGRSPSDIDR